MTGDNTLIHSHGINRRDFMKLCAALAATMGLSSKAAAEMAESVTNPQRPPVIWIGAQECTGCTESLLRATHPTVENLVLETISLEYHEVLSAAFGHQVEENKHNALEKYKGQYVLVVDGSIPLKDNGIYCMVAGEPIVDQFMVARGFMEVETPMMQVIPGGASARPFITHHNALDLDMYLRIAPELYLKRLVVGGFERVFEINRNFRNEGISVRHNPEFTMMELYMAYADYHDLIELTESLFRTLAQEVLGTTKVTYGEHVFDFGKPFEKLTMREAIKKYRPETDMADLDNFDAAKALAESIGITVEKSWGLGRIVTEIFDEVAEAHLIQPTFITEYPAEVSPLARRNDVNPEITDRFEFFIGGREIGNGFSELNDAEDQAERFQEQVNAKAAGDDEAMFYDEDYVTALEYGLPPTAGLGIGIDRMIMLFTNSHTIRDVILFPAMRPQK